MDDATFNRLYVEAERAVMPVIRAQANRFHRSIGIGVDDAVQEGRVAFMEAMREYDYNKARGGLHAYCSIVVRNAFFALLYKATTQTRMPHTVYDDDEGNTQVVRHPMASLDAIAIEQSDAEMPSPAACLLELEADSRAKALRMRLVNGLSERERRVFECKSQPTEAFLIYLRNLGIEDVETATNEHIGRFLGLSKNSVDWSLHKIRRRFVKIAETAEFIDLVQEQIEQGAWPMIHVSRDKDDHEFVRQIIRKRSLDPRPVPSKREIEANDEGGGRVVEQYHWGCVLFLQRGKDHRTLVIEGRFNKNNGEVFGEHGTWKSVADVVPWYGQLTKELKR